MLHSYVFDNFLNDIKKGIMVEVGAAGPNFLSQSEFFRNIGWRCICVEPNPKFVELHKQVGTEIYQYACSDFNKNDIDFEIVNVSLGQVSYESFSSLGISDELFYVSGYGGGRSQFNIENIKVNVRTLDFILDEAKIDQLDYVIVDVEGWEMQVMSGFTMEKYKPKVIVLENNISARIDEYNNYMKKNGYEYDSIHESNYVYVNSNY